VQRQVTRISREPAVWQYEWDAGSRLTAVTTPDHITWRYRYDPFGRRIAKQRLTGDGSIAEQTDFIWDGRCWPSRPRRPPSPASTRS